MSYLDPKNDVAFRKIFGEHPHLCKSLLNALLPLQVPIESIEYMPIEIPPAFPYGKESLVDVRCKDEKGRDFIVEMQMYWTSSFFKRCLYNSAKTYTMQLGKGDTYSDLKPVFSLNLVNDIYEKDTDKFYHEFVMVEKNEDKTPSEKAPRTIDDIQMVFIELPKFKPQTYADKIMFKLWLEFLTTTEEKNKHSVSAELLENEYTKEALELLEIDSYTKAQLNGYMMMEDKMRTERSINKDSYMDGVEVGVAKGIEVGIAKGIEQGRMQEKLNNARAMKQAGMTVEQICSILKLTEEEIEQIETK